MKEVSCSGENVVQMQSSAPCRVPRTVQPLWQGPWGQHTVGATNRDMARSSRGRSVPAAQGLLDHIQTLCPFWGSLYRKGIDKVEQGQGDPQGGWG